MGSKKLVNFNICKTQASSMSAKKMNNPHPHIMNTETNSIGINTSNLLLPQMRKNGIPFCSRLLISIFFNMFRQSNLPGNITHTYGVKTQLKSCVSGVHSNKANSTH